MKSLTVEELNVLGPYSVAKLDDNYMFISGLLGLDRQGNLVEGVEAQTHQIFENLSLVLAKANVDISCVMKTTIFLSDLKNFDQVNKIYASYLKEPFPARSTIQVAALPKNADIEIEWLVKLS